MLTLWLGGLTASSLGWQWIFYLTGAAGCAWVPLWFCLVPSKPKEGRGSRRITAGEEEYLQKVIGPFCLLSFVLFCISLVYFYRQKLH